MSIKYSAVLGDGIKGMCRCGAWLCCRLSAELGDFSNPNSGAWQVQAPTAANGGGNMCVSLLPCKTDAFCIKLQRACRIDASSATRIACLSNMWLHTWVARLFVVPMKGGHRLMIVQPLHDDMARSQATQKTRRDSLWHLGC